MARTAMTSTIVVEAYRPEQAAAWDAFVDRSPHGLFLFRRGYVDYHADRFRDASLWLTADVGPVAVLPASTPEPGVVVSHGGLTFGGLVPAPSARLRDIVDAVDALRRHAAAAGLHSLLYKQLPAFLADPVASADTYALHRAGAAVARVEPNLVVDLAARPPAQARRLRSSRRATRAGVEVRETADLATFWDAILSPVLADRHGTRPTHDRHEIALLAARFPDRIALRAAYLDDEMIAGALLFRHQRVVHAQYIGATDVGREHGALDLVFLSLLAELEPAVRFLSFGIASEDGGAVLNDGLTEWKEGFGARCLPHLVYELLP